MKAPATPEQKPLRLTDKQIEVLELISGGLTPKAAAPILGLSLISVYRRLTAAIRRNNAGTDVHLAVLYTIQKLTSNTSK